MPLNARTTTAVADDTRLNKQDARAFTVIVANQAVYYELNVAPFGGGESWQPIGGIILYPGLWNFNATDWQEYGVDRVQGIRFRSVITTDPGVVSVN